MRQFSKKVRQTIFNFKKIEIEPENKELKATVAKLEDRIKTYEAKIAKQKQELIDLVSTKSTKQLEEATIRAGKVVPEKPKDKLESRIQPPNEEVIENFKENLSEVIQLAATVNSKLPLATAKAKRVNEVLVDKKRKTKSETILEDTKQKRKH